MWNLDYQAYWSEKGMEEEEEDKTTVGQKEEEEEEEGEGLPILV